MQKPAQHLLEASWPHTLLTLGSSLLQGDTVTMVVGGI